LSGILGNENARSFGLVLTRSIEECIEVSEKWKIKKEGDSAMTVTG